MNKKQDRTGVRLPSDIERKYDLGLLDEVGKGGSSNTDVERLKQDLSDYKLKTDESISQLSQSDTEINNTLDNIVEDVGEAQAQIYSQQQQIGALRDTDTDLQHLVKDLQDQVANLQGTTPTFALVDRVTGITYNLYMSNGVLMLEGGDL